MDFLVSTIESVGFVEKILVMHDFDENNSIQLQKVETYESNFLHVQRSHGYFCGLLAGAILIKIEASASKSIHPDPEKTSKM